jgi:hypothetical protein
MFTFHEIKNQVVAEITDDSFIISGTQDLLDIMGDLYEKNCSRVIIREKNLSPDFFKLHTGLAGDILQKFSNYSMKLAVIGDFAKYKSKNLQDFFRESNKGNRIFFVGDPESALSRLTS